MISNEEYEEALNNKDNNNILESVISKYRGSIDSDDLSHCKHVALWKALKSYDPKKKTKFTSYLYTIANNYCKNMCKKKKSIQIGKLEMVVDETDFQEGVDVYDLLEKVPEYKKIIHQRYILCMTWKEIAKDNNCCIASAVQKVSRGLEKMRIKSL